MSLNKKTIAIIGGTGKEGSGLALRWATVGYQVIIGSRQAEKAQAIAEELNLLVVNNSIVGMTNIEAVKQADLCVLTVEQSAHQSILAALRGVLAGKILVDATSRVDYCNPLPPEAPSAAQLAQTYLGSMVRVVAAFQSVPARLLRNNLGESLDAEVLVCSDDMDAANEVIRLAQVAGMRGYYAGPLVNSIVVEGLTSILINLNKYYGVKNARIRITGTPQG